MKCRIFTTVVACSALLALLSGNAQAAIHVADNIVLVPYGNSGAETLVTVVYVPPEDKQRFAVALGPKIAGIHVDIKYEDAGSTVTYGASSP